MKSLPHRHLVALAFGLAAVLTTASAAAVPPGFAPPTASARRPGLVRRAFAPVGSLVRRGLGSRPANLLRKNLTGRPMGQLVRRGVVRQVEHLFFVGAVKRAKQRASFRTFLRDVEHRDRQRAAEASQLQPAESAAEPTSAVELYGNHLEKEGTGRRRVNLLFGLALGVAGNATSLVQQDPLLGVLLGLAGAAIFVENNWWLSQKVDNAIRSTLKQLRDRGVEVPVELGKAFNIKAKAEPPPIAAEGAVSPSG